MQIFLKYILQYKAHSRSNNIAVPWGDDFGWDNAEWEFTFTEELIKYINEHNGLNIVLLQSTPEFYVKALKNENITWPTQYGDMISYSDAVNNYWSGYYSTRAGTKKFVKDTSARYHSISSLLARRVVN